MRRSFVYILIGLLPLIALWFAIYSVDPNRIIRDIPSAAPKWIEVSQVGDCSSAITGTPVTDQTPALDANRASRIGAGVVESQTDLLTLSGHSTVAFKPLLVNRQFPDNQSHLAWVYGEGRITDNAGMSAAAEVVYIDAMTGDSLLLIKDIHAADPSFTCTQISSLNEGQIQKWLRQGLLYFVGLVVSAIYLIVAGTFGFRLYRRNASFQTTNPAVTL